MPDPSARALQAGQRRLDAAAAAQEAGDLGLARRRAAAAVAVLRRGLGAQAPDLAPAWLALGHLRAAADEERGAASAYGRAAAQLRGLRRDEDCLRLWLEAMTGLAHARIHLAHYRAAEASIEAALAVARRRLGPASVEAARLLNARGKLCKYTGRFERGRRAYLRALAVLEAQDPDSEDVAAVLHNLGGLFHAWGDFAQAEPWARRALELRRALEGPDGVGVAVELAAWAPILDELGRGEEAAAALRAALPVFRAAGMRYDVAVALHNLAEHEPDPEATLRQAIALKVELRGAEHWDVALSEARLAALLGAARPEQALGLARHALSVFERTLGGDHPHTLGARRILAGLG